MKTQRLGLGASCIIAAVMIWLATVGATSAAHFDNAAVMPLSQVLTNGTSQKIGLASDLASTSAFTAYLPLVSNIVPRAPAGIYGQVTYQGTPIDGIEIRLNRCFPLTDGWICPSNYAHYTSTLADGSYQFPTVSSLGAEQFYQVRWYNGYNSMGNSNYLSEWYGPRLLTYTAGQVVSGGSFDIANTLLLAPADAVTVSLPVVFDWSPRIATPTDSYRLILMGTADASYWQSPPLGHAGSYTLTSLPSGFTPGTQYAWMIEIHTSDGRGFSQEGRTITFSSGSKK